MMRVNSLAFVCFWFCTFHVKSQELKVDLSGQSISSLPDSLFKESERISELNLGSAGGIFVVTSTGIRPLTFGTGIPNMFQKLPDRIGSFKNLKVIDLSFNDLLKLPLEFYSLPIEELNLNFNYRFDLKKESLNLSRIKTLKRFYFIGVKFDSFPEDIFKLELEELALGNFDLIIDDKFISVVSRFSNLKELYLFDVKMDALPSNLDRLHSLERLDIRYSSTKQLRTGIAGLTKLKNLKKIHLYGLPLSLTEVGLLNEALVGVEIEFLSN